MNKFLEFLGKLVVFILMTVFSGWVLSVMWGWFVVPFGIQPITIPWAAGLSGLIIALAPGIPEEKDYTTVILYAIIVRLMVLGVGYVCTWFM